MNVSNITCLNPSHESWPPEEQSNNGNEVSTTTKIKKIRGKNQAYRFLIKVAELNDVNEKRKEAKMRFVREVRNEGLRYYTCRIRSCSYKWKTYLTSDFDYDIHETIEQHNHTPTAEGKKESSHVDNDDKSQNNDSQDPESSVYREVEMSTETNFNTTHEMPDMQSNNGDGKVSSTKQFKKVRGKNQEYRLLTKVPELADIDEKRKEAKMRYVREAPNEGLRYYTCKDRSCSYKWKTYLTAEFDYEIHETTVHHNHTEMIERKNGLSQAQKEIIDNRIRGSESLDPESIRNVFQDMGVATGNWPSNEQITNYVQNSKRKIYANANFCMDDNIKNMVNEVLTENPDIVNFQYNLNDVDTAESNLMTYEELIELQRQHESPDGLTENDKSRNSRLSREQSSSVTMDESHSLEGTSYDGDNYMGHFGEFNDTTSPTSSNSRKRGRPIAYSNEEERKKAKVQSSKKYIEHQEERYKQLKNEVIIMGMENQDLFQKFNELLVNGAVPEDERTFLQNMLNEKGIFETMINDRENALKGSLPNVPADGSITRTAKQRLLVQRVRMKRKKEREIVEKKHAFYQRQNEELKNRIENLHNFVQWGVVGGNELNEMVANDSEIEVLKTEIPFDEDDAISEPIQLQLPYPTISPHPDEYQPSMLSDQYPLQINIVQEIFNDPCSLYSLLPKYANFITPSSSNFINLTTLQLQNANVNEVCECFFEKLPPSLTFLDLSNNSISFISKSISKLKNLRTINLSNNLELQNIPWESLPQNTEKLNLSNTGIEKISATSNLQEINTLEFSNTKLTSLPIGFESLCNLQYLNLSSNKFDKNSNLKELLWNRLPPNLSILKLCNNNLGELPCLLKSKKFKYLSVNNCNLSKICSHFLNQSRQSNMILEIAGNWQLETLPIIPSRIILPTLTKADTPKNFVIDGLSVFTDNESFISMSRFPTTADNKPIYPFKECDEMEESCCKCCACCGHPREKVIKQLMVMDCNLCLSANFDETKINLFENGNDDKEVNNIMEQLIDKIKNKMHLVYAPSNWKTEVVTGLCLKCLSNLKAKVDEAALGNKMKQQPENALLKAEESLFTSDMHHINYH